MSMLIDAYRFVSGPPPGLTLYDELIADGPVNYWRNGEPNTAGGMIDEVAADGSYVGSVSMGNPAIYPGSGAPTSITGFSGTALGVSAVFPTALTEMTLVSVVKLNATTGFQPVGTNRDENGGGRKYQWRSNGTAMEFVKIVGGVDTLSQAGVFVAGVSCIVSIEIDASGNYAMYKDGVSIKTGTTGAADYGGAGDQYQIGFVTGIGAAMDGYTCENAVFDYVVGPTRQAAYATAAGL